MHPISDRVFLEGALRAPRSDARITVLNPSTGEPLGRIPDGGAADVEDAVAAAAAAAASWAATPARERGAMLSPARESPPRERRRVRAPRQPGQRADACGNPGPGDAKRRAARLLRGGGGQARRAGGAAREQRLRGDRARALRGDRRAHAPGTRPLLQIAQKTSHALAAGNAAVVKPSPLACFSTLHYATLATEAGPPSRSPQRRDGRRGHRARARRRRPGGQGHLHRLDRDRAPDRERLRGAGGFGGP